MARDRGYVLISPCRNEAGYMRQTLDSVLAQTTPPSKWIIVDDGSTDATPQILAEYAARHPFIEVVTLADRGHRQVGPGVVNAFYAGYAHVPAGQYEFLCKLDLDLRLPPRYFEILIGRMNADRRIATCSGKAYIDVDGTLVNEHHGDETSLGMTKFYRSAAFELVGGFVREVMWDGIDCHRCRMEGMIAVSWDEPDLRFVHLRPMGSSQTGILTGRARHGYGQYFMGTSLLYQSLSALSRARERPYVIGSLAMIWGWVRSAVASLPRYDDLEFRKFLRRYQRLAMRLGKQRAAESMRRERVRDGFVGVV